MAAFDVAFEVLLADVPDFMGKVIYVVGRHSDTKRRGWFEVVTDRLLMDGQVSSQSAFGFCEMSIQVGWHAKSGSDCNLSHGS